MTLPRLLASTASIPSSSAESICHDFNAKLPANIPFRHFKARCNPNVVVITKSASAACAMRATDNIPYDPVVYRIPDWWQPTTPPFVHNPIITYRRRKKITVVKGPVEPTIPPVTSATKDGWKKWFGNVAAAKAAAIQAAKQKTLKRTAYFAARKADREADYQAKCIRAEAAGRPTPKRKKHRESSDCWLPFVKNEQLVSMILEGRSLQRTKQRMREFEHHCSIPFGDRVYTPYGEKFEYEDGTAALAVRSWLGPISLALFNSSLPKDIRYGNNKETEYSASATCEPRLFALDKSHVVLDRSRRCAFIVDLDRWWPDLAALRADLRRLLPPGFMPNIITYRGAEGGKGGVENPHLCWLLPPGSRVIWQSTLKPRKNYKGQVKLHEMIQAGIVNHLIEIGADPGHTNVAKTKNPLSPGYSIEICDDHFKTMEEWRSFLPTITPNRIEMKRRHKILKVSNQCDVEVRESMAIWNDAKAFRSIEIATAQRLQNPTFIATVKQTGNEAFIDWLYDDNNGVVVKRLLKVHPDSKALRAVLRAQRQFVIDLDRKPGVAGKWCDRGRDAEANAARLRDFGLRPLPSNATKEERVSRAKLLKHWARQRTQNNKKAIHCGLIMEEMERRLAAGITIVKADVVKALTKAGTVSRSVAYAHVDEVLEIVLRTARYQDGTSYQPSHTAHAIETPEAVTELVSRTNPSSVESFDPVNKQLKSPSEAAYPPWVANKDTLILYEDACCLCNEWTKAVATWRSASRRRRYGRIDLADDPEFREIVLQRSIWTHH